VILDLLTGLVLLLTHIYTDYWLLVKTQHTVLCQNTNVGQAEEAVVVMKDKHVYHLLRQDSQEHQQHHVQIIEIAPVVAVTGWLESSSLPLIQ
jgi:hypothetical protein